MGGVDIVGGLRRALFSAEIEGDGLNVYALLDGAAVPDLLDQLYADEPPEFVCLYSGELEPDLAECAPYLVRLIPESPFTEWLLDNSCENSWGIFATSAEDIGTMRRHFRKFLMVKDPNGNQVYFRFYDPRVLTVYLPTANAEELGTLFGPIAAYFSKSAANGFIAFSKRDGKLEQASCISLHSEKIN